MDSRDLRDLSLSELNDWVSANGLKPYTVTQLLQWLYRQRVRSFAEMTNLSTQARALLSDQFTLQELTVASLHISQDGSVKFGFRLADGAVVESVLMPQPGRITLCVSSQVGCAMGCTFCKTALMKLSRNLTQAEILGQVIAAMRFLEDTATGLVAVNTGTPAHQHKKAQCAETVARLKQIASCNHITNVVYMGMGEPLHNFWPVVESVRILLGEHAFNFSQRKVTVSTCGIAPRIVELAREVPARLAVSLNTADDRLRNTIMPINRRYDLAALMTACREYAKGKRYPVTFEYVLMEGLNDSEHDAARLVRCIAHTPCKINLIPFNEYAGAPYRRPSEEKLLAFHRYLADRGFQVNIRYSKGLDVMAACGQLAWDSTSEKEDSLCSESLAS